MNILPGNMRFGAGQPVKRLEDHRLLTGKGQFLDDKPEAGALWLYVLRSPHAHAKIVSVDTKAASGMADVTAVFTGADLVADDIGTLPTLMVFARPDGSPMNVPPRRLLAHELVRLPARRWRRWWRNRVRQPKLRRRPSRSIMRCCRRWLIPSRQQGPARPLCGREHRQHRRSDELRRCGSRGSGFRRGSACRLARSR